MFFKRKIWNDGAPFEDFMGRDGAPPVARRHLAYGGGKGGSGGTTYQTQKTEIPPEVRARYDAINARAEQVAQQPFTPYGGQFVAPLTATQQQGIQQIGQAGQSYQPYQQAATTALTGGAEAGLPFYGQAAGNIAQAQGAGQPYTGLATQAGLAGTQAIAPQALNIGAYQNPYIQSVVDPTMAALRQQQQMEQSQLMGQQAMRGAFGGDRGSIAAANLARQQGLASAQTEAGLRSQGFQQALQAAQQQQGVGLGAAQANRAAVQQFSPQALAIGQQAFQQPMAAAQAQQQLGQGLLGYGQNVAQGLSGLGQQGAQLGLATGQAQLGAGTLEQQTQQQLNSAFYNQFQQQQGYPFQVAQFLANIGMGTGPLYGSTTTGVTGQPTPFFSDERVKEDITEIGRTHDGQKIIKFKYKGSNQPHIGLSAQDVEKHHPEAVSEFKGIKAVDYDAATKQAERAYGGGLMPSSEGGAVHPSMAGLGFAAGGTPGVDDYSRELLQGMADPRHKTTPFGGGLPGGKQSWRVAPTQPAQILGSGVQLKAPAQRPTGLSEVMGGVKDAVSAVETGEKVYKGGEKAYDWAREQAVGAPARPAVPATGNTPGRAATSATPGAFGYGGTWNARAPTQTSAAPPPAPGLGAAEPQRTAEVAPAPGLGAAKLETAEVAPAPSEITTASLDALPTEDVASLGGLEGLGGLGEGLGGLEGLSGFAARGGRIGYNPGGLVGSNPALPYTGGDDDKSIVEDLADDPQKQNKLDAPKLDMSAGAGAGGDKKKDGTGKAVGSLVGAGVGAMFGPVGMGLGSMAGGMLGGMVARGGRIGYAEGGGGVDAAMMADAKRRIAGIESGGRYDALGPMVGGDRAHGKYQVMGANLPSWTQEALGRRMTPEEFLKSPEAQERVFEHHFGKYLGQHGNLADAASMWHSGVPLSEARRQGRRDVNMSTEDYVRKIMGGAPPAEAHMRPEMPEPRHAGLAPKISVDDEEPMGLVPDDDENFEMPDRFNRFASGGLVPRNGYPMGGEVAEVAIDPDRVDPKDPAQVALLKAQIQRAAGAPPAPQSTPTSPPGGVAPADPRTYGDRDLVGHNLPATGVAPTPSTPDPDRNFFDRAGDWYGRNQNWVLPLAGGIGKMLASRSPYFLNAAGEGLAEAAPLALGASQKQQSLEISKQRANVDTAEAIQRQIWEAQSQRINVLKNDANADVSSYNDIIKRLTSKLYTLYGVPGEGLAMSTPQRSSGALGQLHPSLDIGFMYQQLAGASPEERTRITAQIEAAKAKIASGQQLLAADGWHTIVPDENLKKQLDIETAKVDAGIKGQTGGMLSAERRGILTDQYVELDKLITAKESQLGAPGVSPEAAALLDRQVRQHKMQLADIVRQLGVNRMPPFILPRQTGGRVAMQAGGDLDPFAPVDVAPKPIPPGDPAALVPRILDPMTSAPVRAQLQKQYDLLTPQQKTPSGTTYRLNPLAGTTPDTTPEPPLPPMTPGSVDPRTGGVSTSIPVLPYSKTGGFPSDPGLPKQPYILEGTDSYYATAQQAAEEQEKAFMSRATGQQADINMASMLKFGNALKVVEAGGLTMDKARVANMLRGLGLGSAADVVQREPDTRAAYLAAKTALDAAIQKSSTSFAAPTQSQFERVASEATPSANIPGGAAVSLLKENMAQQLWQNALREDWNTAREKGVRNFGSFLERWREAHPPGLFRESADRLLGNIKGGELPPLSKLTEGVVYVVPKDMGDHKLKTQLGAEGLRPGDLFVLRGIEHSVDPETKKERFRAADLQRVDPDKGYEVHSGAPGLRFKRPQ